MADPSTIYRLAVLCALCAASVWGAQCPVLECWFVQEKAGARGGGFPAAMTQEKSLMIVSRESEQPAPPHSDGVQPNRVYQVTDAGGSLCRSSLRSVEGAVEKPQCEINPFLPQPALVQWAAPLTSVALSPAHLQADWLSASLQGLDGRLVLSNVMRVPTGTNQATVVLSVFSRTPVLRSRLDAPVLLDCGFWAWPGWPLAGSGFAVEWRYQHRGEGRLLLAYDGKGDRLDESREERAGLDVEAVHRTGNASLSLERAEVRHAGTYICTVYLPYILAQVAMELEIIEPPTLTLSPSPVWAVSGQSVSVQCEASGFYPLALELDWEYQSVGGSSSLPLPGGDAARLSGHRQGGAGTFSQSSRLELGAADLGALGPGGQLLCVARHQGGVQRANVTVHIAGASGPSIEDSMAMVAVALVLYGLVKLVYWSLGATDSTDTDGKDKSE